MRTLGTLLMLVAAVALVAFPISYQFTTGGTWRRLGSWKESSMGVHLMSFMGVLGMVMVFAILNLLFELPSWVRPFVWLCIGVVAWWRLLLLFKLQRRRET